MHLLKAESGGDSAEHTNFLHNFMGVMNEYLPLLHTVILHSADGLAWVKKRSKRWSVSSPETLAQFLMILGRQSRKPDEKLTTPSFGVELIGPVAGLHQLSISVQLVGKGRLFQLKKS